MMRLLYGALAAATVRLFIRDWQAERAAAGIGIALVFAFYLYLGHAFIDPYIQRYQRYQAERAALQSNPALIALKRYDAATFARVMAALRADIDADRPPEKIRYDVLVLIGEQATRDVGKSSDDSALLFLNALSEALNSLQGLNKTACFQWLHPSESANIDIEQYLDSEQIRRINAAYAEVIESAHVNPGEEPSLDTLESDRAELMSYMQVKYGSRAEELVDVKSTARDKDGICDMSADMFNAFRKLPSKNAAQLFRYLYSQP